MSFAYSLERGHIRVVVGHRHIGFRVWGLGKKGVGYGFGPPSPSPVLSVRSSSFHIQADRRTLEAWLSYNVVP